MTKQEINGMKAMCYDMMVQREMAQRQLQGMNQRIATLSQEIQEKQAREPKGQTPHTSTIIEKKKKN